MDQKIDPSSDKSSKNFDARSQISLQKGPKTILFCTNDKLLETVKLPKKGAKFPP